ncbi:hypothetical protein [Pseudoalteromonas umbrosa]|uniref:hypothetical protein n=1 Tax=Pseudoalteromonas umbrosa TaxID=3048489 RepID=UPI0024C45DCD|nr:hypothetical protein [Pseudoalteromonas sp. B95]MDK1290098.1 hypothetical protein [Pseudoalteromonas sp. B95]
MKTQTLAEFDFGKSKPRSHTREYRSWYYLKRKAQRQSIPFQKSWREDYEQFKADVGEPPKPTGYQLVLRQPEQGYIWSNVFWISNKRVNSHKPLVWLKYKRQFHEVSQLAESFGVTLSAFERWRGQGWSVRKIEAHAKKLYEQKQHNQWALRRAGQTKPNPNV